MDQKEMKLVYDTLLSTPGMNEVVKLDLRISRKQILLLSQLLEKGLELKWEGFSYSTEEEKQSVKDLIILMLDKSGLSETAANLKMLLKSKA